MKMPGLNIKITLSTDMGQFNSGIGIDFLKT